MIENAPDGRHPGLIWNGGNLLEVEAITPLRVALDFGAGREDLGPHEGVDHIPVGIDKVMACEVLRTAQKRLEGPEGVVCLVDEVGPLDLPESRRIALIVVVNHIAIFEYAADFKAREVE